MSLDAPQEEPDRAGPLEPSLQNIVAQKSLKWIFVGGKGGVGKTTTSCALAIQLSRARKSVLLISTDPAHNLSDAFGQKFGKAPTLVQGFANLYAMEIDPSSTLEGLAAAAQDGAAPASQASFASLLQGGGGSFLAELSASIPGIDEAMGFAEVMKLVKSLEYDVIVFDTAPTGHTLRFLSFPNVMEKALHKLTEFTGRFGGLIQQVSGFMGAAAGGAAAGFSAADLLAKMAELKAVVEEVNAQFKNPDRTTFVCVCISEFLSLYETERMIQELANYHIDTHNIVVNQLLFPSATSTCENCLARRRMQAKYLAQIHELYADFHVILLPLLTKEVRGVKDLDAFSHNLITPFEPPRSV